MTDIEKELREMRKEINEKLDFISSFIVARFTGDLKKSDL
jgi:hypothetical protein